MPRKIRDEKGVEHVLGDRVMGVSASGRSPKTLQIPGTPPASMLVVLKFGLQSAVLLPDLEYSFNENSGMLSFDTEIPHAATVAVLNAGDGSLYWAYNFLTGQVYPK